MANEVRGELEVQAKDGKAYTFVLGLTAGAALEARLSTETERVKFPVFIQNLDDMRKIRSLWWAAAQLHHPEMTEEDVGRVLDQVFPNVKVMMAKVNRLIELSYPSDEDAKAAGLTTDGRPRKAQHKANGTGGISTSNPVALG